MSFSTLDWLLVGILAVSFALSIFKGFTREVLSLAALVWGFLLAAWYYPQLARVFAPYLRAPEFASLAAFITILAAVLIAGGVLSSFFGKMLETAGLQWFDRVLGGVFGLIRGLLLCLIVVFAAAVFSRGPQPLAGSRVAPYLVSGARMLVLAAPYRTRERFRSGVRRAEDVWRKRSQTRRSQKSA